MKGCQPQTKYLAKTFGNLNTIRMLFAPLSNPI